MLRTEAATDVSNQEEVKLKREQKYSSYRRKRKTEEKPQNYKGTLRRLVKLLAPHKYKMLVILIATISTSLLNVAGPRIMADVIDAITAQITNKLSFNVVDFSGVKRGLLIMFVIYLGASLFTYLQQYTMAGVSQRLVCFMREKVNDKLSHIPLKFFDNNTKGDILSRLMNDIDNLSSNLQNNMVTVITSVIQLVGVFAVMLFTSWKMTAIVVAFIPLSSFIAWRISRKSKVLFRQLWDRTGELNGHVEEMYTGHNIVKLFGYEQQAIWEFNDINEELYSVAKRAHFISGIINPFLTYINNIVYVLICIVGGMLILNGEFTLGSIVAFISYSKMFASPINRIAHIVNNIQSSLASSERVFNLLDEEEEPEDNITGMIKEPKGKVEFENVCFRYLEDKPLIEDMNLTVNTGDLIALVGPTGSGKTTFVNLLMRFYDVDSGAIKVDGVDIRDIPRENLRSLFGMVLQDTWLFKGTVRENIAYGKQDATDEEIIAAARAAWIHDFIETLPKGYETLLEEDGTNISQGQRQLLTIARAILANPVILILDEATSSVDTRTEMHIQLAMKTLMQGRTSFVIAHRLSTIRNAHNILVMRRGTIVEQGTHEQLLEADGFYAMLYNSQYVGGIPPEEAE